MTGTVTASKITSSSSLSLDSNGGSGVIVGANSPKQTGQDNTFIVINNSTDLTSLLAVRSQGTSSGQNDIYFNAPFNLQGSGYGTAGYYLVSGGPSSPPTWVSTGGGTFNPAAPGPLGNTTPNTGNFTSVTCNSYLNVQGSGAYGQVHATGVGVDSPVIIISGTIGTASSANTSTLYYAIVGLGGGYVNQTIQAKYDSTYGYILSYNSTNYHVFNNLVYTPTISANGFTTPYGQGAYMGWNRSATGVTCFYNQQGGGSGGWEWVGYNSSNVSTGVCMTLAQSTSSLSVSGNVSAANITSGTWTPSFFASPNSATFSSTTINYARYSISGKTVTISMDVQVSWSSANVSNCYLYCSGLPFTVGYNGSGTGGYLSTCTNGGGSNFWPIVAEPQNGTANVLFSTYTAPNAVQLPLYFSGGTFKFVGSFSYIIN